MGKATRNDKKRTTKSKQLVKDFEKKTRKKLGKKLKPANLTEVSYQSHSIHVSKQSLKDQTRLLRKSIAEISEDITESISHLSHHTGKVRKNVLIELKGILSRVDFESEPQKFKCILQENLVTIVTVFELAYDHDTQVRDQLRMFVNWLMPKIADSNCIQLFCPFWSHILANLSGALSHIRTSIRLNALKILRSFFSVSCCSKYFSLNWCLSLLSHLELLFYDIINLSGDIKKAQNRESIIHILCECTTHIVRSIHSQMCNSSTAIEESLHALLLPVESKMLHSTFEADLDERKDGMDVDGMEVEIMNNDNLKLLRTLLSILSSICILFEDFAKKHKYSSMNMILTLCDIISQCLAQSSMHKLIEKEIARHKMQTKLNNKKNKNKNKKNVKLSKNKNSFSDKNKNDNSALDLGDVRLMITKCLMSLFRPFPLEFLLDIKSNDAYVELDEETERQIVIAEKNGDLSVMRLNIKVMHVCLMFVDYWKYAVMKDNQNSSDGINEKKMNYVRISYRWLMQSLSNVDNAKITVDMLGILRKLIVLYSQQQQMKLVMSLDGLLKRTSFQKSDTQTIIKNCL